MNLSYGKFVASTVIYVYLNIICWCRCRASEEQLQQHIKIQEELTGLLRERGEKNQEIIDLKNKLQEYEKQLSVKEAAYVSYLTRICFCSRWRIRISNLTRLVFFQYQHVVKCDLTGKIDLQFLYLVTDIVIKHHYYQNKLD